MAPLPGPPTAASVVDGRFVHPVVLDGGGLRVDPPAADEKAAVSQDDAAKEIWASNTFTGHHADAFGFGVVTITVPAAGVAAVHDLPAWVAFATAAAASCPAEIGSPTSQPLPPDNGVAAVVLGAADRAPVVAYRARTSLCGQPPMGPSITAVDEVVSVPWVAAGPLADGTVDVVATIPPCGTEQGASAGGTRAATTITVYALVPDDHDRFCPLPQRVTETIQLSPPIAPGAPPPVVSAQTAILHGPLGPARQVS